MNKLRKMSLIVIIPIVLGAASMIIGGLVDNDTMYSVGVWILSAGIPLTMFVLVVVGLILMITGKIDLADDKRASGKKQDEQSEWEEVDENENDNEGKDNDNDSKVTNPQTEKQDEQSEWEEVDDDDADEKPHSEREREYSDLAAINTSHGRSNREKEAEYMIRRTANNYRNAPKKDKILGWTFFGFLMTDFALIIVFFMLNVFVGAIVCFCIFGGTILIALLVTVLRQKISMGLGISKKKKSDALDGTVRSCDVASTTKVNNRITKVVYQVIISDGENEYNAYTEDFYETGDKVKFCKIGKRLVCIVDEELEDDEPLDN